jgi:hypothetical protein
MPPRDLFKGEKMAEPPGGELDIVPGASADLVAIARAYIDRAIQAADTGALEELRAKAAGYQDYYTRREAARDRANGYGEIKVRAERGLGQIDLAESPGKTNDAYKPGASSPGGDALFERRQWKPDVSASTRAGWRKLATVPDEQFEQSIANAYNDQEAGVTTARVLYPKTGGPGAAEKLNQGLTPEWYTPARYVEAARAVLGGIDLDPASSAAANATVGAATFYHKDDSGLDHPWRGRVWLNPPYGGTVGPVFAARLITEYEDGEVTAAIALLNSTCVTNGWFRPFWDYLLCFHYGRIAFGAGTDERTGPTHGNVFAYLGADPGRFDKVFSEFGAVVQRRSPA